MVKEKHGAPFQQTRDTNFAARVSASPAIGAVFMWFSSQWRTSGVSFLCCRLLEQRLSISLAETGNGFVGKGFFAV